VGEEKKTRERERTGSQTDIWFAGLRGRRGNSLHLETQTKGRGVGEKWWGGGKVDSKQKLNTSSLKIKREKL